MISLKEIITSNIFYHGTPKESNGLSILRDGIKPGNIYVKRGHKLTPVINKTYLSPNLKTAIIYTIGMNAIGDNIPEQILKNDGQFGYLFVIKGNNKLNNPQPDEDSIGEILYTLINDKQYSEGNYHINKNQLSWLVNLAKNKLTSQQYQKVMRYMDYGDLTVAGKKLVKYMNKDQKEQLINAGANIANEGIIIPDECWKLDKNDNKKLDKNGSNFFKIAKRIK